MANGKAKLVKSFEIGQDGLQKIDYNPLKKCFVFHYENEVVEIYMDSADLLRYN